MMNSKNLDLIIIKKNEYYLNEINLLKIRNKETKFIDYETVNPLDRRTYD